MTVPVNSFCTPAGQPSETLSHPHLLKKNYVYIYIYTHVWKKTNVTDEWIKMCSIKTVEYYTPMKRNGALAPAMTWMNL